MSLLLCRQEKVTKPFFVEEMGIRLYSSQELCYVIYNHPLLVLDGFVDERLIEFLRDELNLGFLALKLERWKKSGENPDEMLMIILAECDYYNSAEITRFRQLVGSLRKRHPAEYLRLKGDELFVLRQYSRAAVFYQQALEVPEDKFVDGAFQGKVWNNLAAAYARMFQLDKAFDAYQKAYEKGANPQILERLYDLSAMDDRLFLDASLREKITDEMRENWDEHLARAREKALQSPLVGQLEALFERDPVKRQAGASQLLAQWKKEYRNMA